MATWSYVRGKKNIERDREKRKKRAYTDKDIRKGRAPFSKEDVKRGYIKGSEKRESKKTEPITKPTIHLKPKEKTKTGIAAFREKDTFAGKAVKAATSLKTTAILGTVLAGLLTYGAATGGAAAATTGIARITQTVSALGRTQVAQRAFVGRSTTSGIDKIFHATRPIAARFAVNQKSSALSTSLLSRVVTNPAFIIGAIGSYPFAHFIKEEALQTLNIAVFKAVEAGDLEGARELNDTVKEMVQGQGTIIKWIPYANVVEKLIGKNGFFETAGKAADEWNRIMDIKEAEATGEKETEFSAERRKTDEEAKQREIEEMQWKAEYYALIRNGQYEEAEELLNRQGQGGK